MTGQADMEKAGGPRATTAGTATLNWEHALRLHREHERLIYFPRSFVWISICIAIVIESLQAGGITADSVASGGVLGIFWYVVSFIAYSIALETTRFERPDYLRRAAAANWAWTCLAVAGLRELLL